MTSFEGRDDVNDEEKRLRALRTYEIVDTIPEPAFDEIVALAAELCDVPIALMTLIDDKRQWFKSAIGTEERSTARELAFCAHTIEHDGVMVVSDATKDERFAGNPMVVGHPHVRFYAGVPIRTPAGLALGTLCVIGRTPRDLDEREHRVLETLGRQIEAQLELRLAVRELARREKEAVAQREATYSVQLEKNLLVALVVHDVKSPLTSIVHNAEFVADQLQTEDGQDAANGILASAQYLNDMVLNLLDVTRGESGEIVPNVEATDVAALFDQVKKAMTYRTLRSHQSLTVDSRCEHTVQLDPSLMRRVLENLVDNALKYGATHVRLEGRTLATDETALDVTDDGPGIPPEFHERIFEAYERVGRDPQASGVGSRGLGLAFCRLAVAAHGGTIDVVTNQPRGAIFRIRLPVAGALESAVRYRSTAKNDKTKRSAR
ncbi:MAG TPA: ATP-binding protein [Polyangiaceae bacterium]